MSDVLETDPINKAREMGLEVIEPAPEELFIDIDDGKVGMAHMIEMLEIINKELPEAAAISRVTTSKSGGKHVIIRWYKPLSNLERIALQAALGSDRVRETICLLHLFKGTLEQPTLFFEVPRAINEHGPNQPRAELKVKSQGYSTPDYTQRNRHLVENEPPFKESVSLLHEPFKPNVELMRKIAKKPEPKLWHEMTLEEQEDAQKRYTLPSSLVKKKNYR